MKPVISDCSVIEALIKLHMLLSPLTTNHFFVFIALLGASKPMCVVEWSYLFFRLLFLFSLSQQNKRTTLLVRSELKCCTGDGGAKQSAEVQARVVESTVSNTSVRPNVI